MRVLIFVDSRLKALELQNRRFYWAGNKIMTEICGSTDDGSRKGRSGGKRSQRRIAEYLGTLKGLGQMGGHCAGGG